MERFVRIATGLDVGPALAELARQPEYWIMLGANAQEFIPLIGVEDARLLEAELPEVWRLVDTVRERAAADHGDHGRLTFCRVGRMPPGEGLPPHFDGLDPLRERRYQLALQSEAGADLTVDGETKCLVPGEAWQIDVGRTHWVHNGSENDRIIILFDTQA